MKKYRKTNGDPFIDFLLTKKSRKTKHIVKIEKKKEKEKKVNQLRNAGE
jgi:hypothetical protein